MNAACGSSLSIVAKIRYDRLNHMKERKNPRKRDFKFSRSKCSNSCLRRKRLEQMAHALLNGSERLPGFIIQPGHEKEVVFKFTSLRYVFEKAS